MSKYVAVVYVEDSRRPDRDLACFVDDDKDVAIDRALRARKRWSSEDAFLMDRPRNGRTYRILVGELVEEAREPVSYELEPLSE